MITTAALLGAAGIAAGGSILGNLFGGWMNARETNKNRKEAREIDERNFAWQQQLDGFNMDRATRNDNVSIIKAQVDQVNNMLRTNVALRDRMVSLWGGGK